MVMRKPQVIKKVVKKAPAEPDAGKLAEDRDYAAMVEKVDEILSEAKTIPGTHLAQIPFDAMKRLRQVRTSLDRRAGSCSVGDRNIGIHPKDRPGAA